MSTEKIKQLTKKYIDGKTTLEEEQKLRLYFQRSKIPKELQAQADQFQYYEQMRSIEPSNTFNPFAKIDFEAELQASDSEVRKQRSHTGTSAKAPISILSWSWRIAAGFILLIVGFAAGQFWNNTNYASTRQVAELQQEVREMRSTLVDQGNYKNASAGERLSAVNISTRLPVNDQELDGQITEILIYTMNNDANVNVRTAAAEALFRFRKEERIQHALVNALSRQDDPLMQITLIHMLVKLKAKDAINEMQKMLVSSETQDVVREQLKAGIAQLRA